MFRNTTFAVLAAAVTLAGPAARAQTPEETTGTAPTAATTTATSGSATAGLSPADKEFITRAAEGGIAEVQSGQLAGEKATGDDVKSFAQRMVTDHSRANDELKALASAKGATVPADTDPQHKQALEKLRSLSGEEFDKAYMKGQVQDHAKTIALFQKEVKEGQDGELKAWATKTLPILREHARQAREVAKAHGVEMKGKGKKGKHGGKKHAGGAGTNQ